MRRTISLVPFLLLSLPGLAIAQSPSDPYRSAWAPVAVLQAQLMPVAAEQFYQTGSRLYQEGQLKPALEALKQAEIGFRSVNNRAKLADTLGLIGLVYEALGQTNQAMEAQQQTLALSRELGDRQREGAALSNIASLYIRMGQSDKALELYPQALTLLRAAGDQEGEAATLSAMGRVYRNLGQFDRALEIYQQALTLQRAINDQTGLGTTLNNIGLVYHSQSQYAKAQDFYQQSLAIRREVKDRRGEALTLGNLGSLLAEQGQYAEALERLQQALKLRQAIGDRPGEGTSLNSIAVLYEDLGQPAQAEKFYRQALKIRQEVGDRQGEGATLNNLGRLYANRNQLDQALKYYFQALESRRVVKNRVGEGTVLSNIGEAYRQKGQPEKALEYFQQALAIRRELGQKNGVAITLNNLGTAYLNLNQFDLALKSYQESLKILQEVGDRPTQATLLGNLASISVTQRQYPQAEAYLYQAIEQLESLRPGLSDANRVSIFENQKVKYRLLEQVLAEQGKAEAALVVSERGRARAFVELLARRTAMGENSAQRFSEIKPLTIQEIRQVAQEQQATLVEYSIVVVQDSPNRPGGYKQEILIWVVQPSGTVTLRRVAMPNAPGLKDFEVYLNSLVAEARRSLGVRGVLFQENATLTTDNLNGENSRPPQAKKFQELYQLLIQPIADLLPTNANDRVIFIPHEKLFGVPFAALQDSQNRYLIEKHTILTAPAIQVLQLTRKHRQQTLTQTRQSQPLNLPDDPNEILLVGNPTMPKVSFEAKAPARQLAALPGAEQEAKAIAAVLKAQAITGDQATELLVRSKLPQAKVIHLATHGLLDSLDQSGIPGAIALAGQSSFSPVQNRPDDGLLTASELLDLTLVADLVVLSACDTGRGVITGDSVIGLSRSFMTAGVPSLIVSLWQVPDAPTAFLMVEFYKNLGQQDKAQALRQAMLATLQQYPDPRDWAAFTLIGEAN